MGLTLDFELARTKFAEALALARSKAPLPREWLDRSSKVGAAASKTFTPMLGTALLAKATNRWADVLSLKESDGHKTYSARNLATLVLVPCCAAEGIDLRAAGQWPLNNSPFYKEPRVTLDLKIRPNVRPDLEYLITCLKAADFLEDKRAVEAFAAFLRTRLEASANQRAISVGASSLDLPALEALVDTFLAGDPEGGKVGQAAVAGILDVCFTDVRTKRINDPSRTWPGDVGVFEAQRLTLSAEVKQRSFTPAEINVFARKLFQAGVHRGLIVELASPGKYDRGDLQSRAQANYGVDLAFCARGSDLLTSCCRFSVADLPASLSRFPGLFLDRLTQLEVSDSRRAEWASAAAPAKDT